MYVDNVVVPATSKKDNETNKLLFTLGKPADNPTQDKNKDSTSKSKNKDKEVTKGKKKKTVIIKK